MDSVVHSRQQLHYSMLRELQNLVTELPVSSQRLMTNELLSELAHTLLDGTVFQIVHGLKEIQEMTEKDLFHSRCKCIDDAKAGRENVISQQKDIMAASRLPKTDDLRIKVEDYDKAAKETLKKLDMQIVLDIDQTVTQQQVTLEKAGVPGFSVTNQTSDLRRQMHMLSFIIRLEDKFKDKINVE